MLRAGLLLWIVIVACSDAHGQHRFPIVPSYPTNTAFAIVALDDFNRDGNPDALVLSTDSNTGVSSVYLMLGDGHGGFGKPVTVIPNGSLIYQTITGDFNGDGVPDIALITAANTLQVFLNNGNGSFFPAKASGVLNKGFGTVWAGTVGDFNGDGHLDLVAKDTANNRNLILLGKGDGTFSTPIVSNVPPTSNYGPMVAADLDGDGNLDLAMANVRPNIQIMLGDGKGGFRLGKSIKTKAVLIDSLIAPDLEGKGKPDLVAATGVNFGDNFCVSGFGVAVLSQGSNGDWAEADYPTGMDPERVVAADMNGDGRLDLVVANAFSSSISILLNKRGSASDLFSPAIRYTPGPSFIDNVAVKDLNHDGKPDIVFLPDGALNVLLNQGDARFLSGSLVDVGLSPQALAVSDLNHDGIPDLALVGYNGCPAGSPNQFISILSENGQALATRHLNYSGAVWDIGLGDINGDGSTDAVLSGNPTSKILTSLLNKGNGTFSLASKPFTDVEDDSFAVGNYNPGGKADVATIVTNNNELQVLSGKGNGEFGSPATYHTGSSPVSIEKRDLNGDGYADLVVANSGDNTVSVFLGTASGEFGPGKQYAAGKTPKQVAFGDFNGDGKVDLAVADATSISILLGKGDGTFSSPQSFPVGDQVNYIAVADLRGNGDDDVIVVVDDFNPYMYVLSGDGHGGLGKPDRYSGSDNAVGIQTGDFNGDGAVDLAVQNYGSTGVTIFYNQGGTRISLSSSAKSAVVGQKVTFTATVSASVDGAGTPAGTVEFVAGKTEIGAATLHNGRASLATSKLSKGAQSVVATYLGNSDFNQHSSPSVLVIVK